VGEWERVVHPFVRSKTIYPEEHLENFNEAIYSLFLKVGNIEDILNMSPWDFYDISEFATIQNKKTPHKQLKESQKDMIKRAKGEL